VPTQVIVYLLTALAALVVVLTRLRLARENAVAGRFQVGRSLLNLHTVSGVLALITWVVFLVAGEDSTLGGAAAGIVALAFWWIVALAGLMILVRWMPAGGQHASSPTEDTWAQGPGLSVLAHVGMLVGVVFFTWAYLTVAV
jgi:hypothetical protein